MAYLDNEAVPQKVLLAVIPKFTQGELDDDGNMVETEDVTPAFQINVAIPKEIEALGYASIAGGDDAEVAVCRNMVRDWFLYEVSSRCLLEFVRTSTRLRDDRATWPSIIENTPIIASMTAVDAEGNLVVNRPINKWIKWIFNDEKCF